MTHLIFTSIFMIVVSLIALDDPARKKEKTYMAVFFIILGSSGLILGVTLL